MYNNSIFVQAKNSLDVKVTVFKLLPTGRIEGNEFVVLNPTRNDKNLGSFRVNLINGKWIDHATSDKGSDITSLFAYLNGISQYEAAQYLLENITYSKNQNLSINQPKVTNTHKINVNEYIKRLWNESLNPKNSIIENYLKNRELLLDGIPESIRYCPNLYHGPTGKSFPVMLSAISKYGTDRIVAVHRTYLKTDGSDKADISPNKMMLGKVKGGAVKIASSSSTLVVAEGIETALSIYAATKIPTWACLSASNLTTVELPPPNTTSEIIIAADNDQAGIKAASKLAIRLLDNCYRVKISIPPEGKDFNDLLKEVKS
ncbi:MAG: toprim domain-containing protein [Alphaproteobacteria bacterium]|nr:toprim domain-containing protein [Alphaproteobacteria bacterium]